MINTDEFKTFFHRDFPYPPEPVMDGEDDTESETEVVDPLSYVQNNDIQRAIDEANLEFNQDIFPNDNLKKNAFLYLTAHTLVMNLRASAQGISGNYDWLSTSKGVGSVSTSYSIPDEVSRDPLYAIYAKTSYGIKYFQKIYSLRGVTIFTASGATLP